MTLEICIGSSCHVKGAYTVIEKLRAFIRDNHLKEQVELKACFCMGQCGPGVSVRVDGEKVLWLTPDTCDAFAQSLLVEAKECSHESD